MLSGNILITGGTGSLGTAILERAEREKWDAQFTVIARNESKLNQTRQRFPDVSCEVGDIRDGDWLRTVFRDQEYIIHAAALKIVPVAESNPREAVMTNVVGSLNVAQAAIECGAKRVIGISSDKACGPTYYGLTKRLMEGLFRQFNFSPTDFVLCRYGNVLKSANSLVPLFERQIKEDKPFTVTHKEMTRFWLSMKQAVDLVITTLLMANSGEIFVPRAPAMSVVNLAKTLDPDREIIEIGIRPGERLHETLIVREESLHTYFDQYMTAGGLPMFIICPPTEQLSVSKNMLLGFQYEYTSDSPSHLITSDEMIQLLKDS